MKPPQTDGAQSLRSQRSRSDPKTPPHQEPGVWEGSGQRSPDGHVADGSRISAIEGPGKRRGLFQWWERLWVVESLLPDPHPHADPEHTDLNQYTTNEPELIDLTVKDV